MAGSGGRGPCRINGRDARRRTVPVPARTAEGRAATRGVVRRLRAMSFNVEAAAYDGFMGRYSVLLSPQLADLARLPAGQRALPRGCGPGALTTEPAPP